MRHGPTLAALISLWIVGIALSPAEAGNWSLPDESQGARIAPMLLLSRADIRADLDLNPEQVAEAEKAVAELYNKAAALRGRTDAEAIAQRGLVDEGQHTWFETKLTEPQRDRLSQLDLRWEGPAAIVSRASVAEALDITADQKATLKKALVERNAAHAKNPAEADRQFTARTMAVLTDVQKQHWTLMLGRSFTLRTMTAR